MMYFIKRKRGECQSMRLYRELFHIGLPIILGQVGIILVSFIDNMMVGRYSTDALAAASFVNNLFALVYVFGIGFAYGLTPLVTKASTLGREIKAGILLRHSLILNLCLAVVISLVMLLLYVRLDWFDLPRHLYPLIRPYFLLQLGSFVIFMAANAFKQYFDGAGYTTVGMWLILLSNLVNTIGNYLLIYGQGGFPELGLEGAGIATLLTRVITLVGFYLYFARSAHFTRGLRGFKAPMYSGSSFRELIRLGLPVGTYSGVETMSFTIALLFVTRLGIIPLAVHQILCVVTTIGFFIYYGLGAATTILVSKYRTRGDMLRVRAATNSGVEAALAVACLAMFVMLLVRNHVGWLFTTDIEIISMAAVAIIPVILYQLGDALQVVYANALRGMEDVGYLAVVASGVHIILEPSLAYTFGFCIGLSSPALRLVGIWSAFPVGLLLLGLLLRWRFVRITRDLV